MPKEPLFDKRIRPLKSGQSELDWARLAAYIDGEGTIVICRTNKAKGYKSIHTSLYVKVMNTDFRLTQWLLDTFGGHYTADIRFDRHKNLYTWAVASKNAQEILGGCWPYFIVKREQAAIALQFQGLVKGHNSGFHRTLLPWVVKERDRLYQLLRDMKRVEHGVIA